MKNIIIMISIVLGILVSCNEKEITTQEEQTLLFIADDGGVFDSEFEVRIYLEKREGVVYSNSRIEGEGHWTCIQNSHGWETKGLADTNVVTTLQYCYNSVCSISANGVVVGSYVEKDCYEEPVN